MWGGVSLLQLGPSVAGRRIRLLALELRGRLALLQADEAAEVPPLLRELLPALVRQRLLAAPGVHEPRRVVLDIGDGADPVDNSQH